MSSYKNGCTLTLPSKPHDSKPSAVSAKPVTTAGGPPNDLDLNASVKKLRPASHQIRVEKDTIRLTSVALFTEQGVVCSDMWLHNRKLSTIVARDALHVLQFISATSRQGPSMQTASFPPIIVLECTNEGACSLLYVLFDDTLRT